MTTTQNAPPLLLLALAGLAGLGGSSPAAAQEGREVGQRERPPPPVPLAQPDGLAHFHQALRRLEAGQSERVRVLHYGDSHIAADVWTDVVRRGLQSRFGNGGPGYLLPRRHGSWHRGPTRVKAGRAWKTRRHGFAKAFGPVDGLWGLAGVGIEGHGRGAWLEVVVPGRYPGGHLALHLLGQRPAGRLAVVLDGRSRRRVTAGPAQGHLVRHLWPLSRGRHRLRFRVAGKQAVRLLGVAVERDTPGVVYDVLGINGHRITAFNLWNEELLAAQLRHRPPDLVILNYGGNEALAQHENLPLPQYERELQAALEVIQRLTPRASHLLVGPSSLCPAQPRLDRVAAMMARAASARGYAFWDLRQVTGGPGSLCRWRQAHPGWVAPDGIHFRRGGYEHIGRLFLQALLADY